VFDWYAAFRLAGSSGTPVARPKKSAAPKRVEALKHSEATRVNIPTAEFQAVVSPERKQVIEVKYQRETSTLTEERAERNRDLDPQLVWRGKDEQDSSDLVVQAPLLYIQEKVHPKTLIDDLRRHSQELDEATAEQASLFADFNGIPEGADRTDFYHHEGKWQNRLILGDSLQVMASLAEREALRGKVQCIYLDPPYGIKFNSNFQWSTTSRDVKDGNAAHITREPEQVKAFRDTWRDGIHSYLSYLRDRLTVARDLLTDSGSIFVQIGDENVHRVRSVMDEVFGDANFVASITFKKTGGQSSSHIASVSDYILVYARVKSACKFRALYGTKVPGEEGATNYAWIEETSGHRRPLRIDEKSGAEPIPTNYRVLQPYPMFSDGPSARDLPYRWRGAVYAPSSNAHWKTHLDGLTRLGNAGRLLAQGKTLRFVNFLSDYPVTPLINIWTDTQISGFGADRIYVVQTLPKVIERCMLMASDPGDLVLDPTCGSGTTAYVAEQWGRRWITIDTSRVALALTRARIMGARYPYYLLADSPEGQQKEAEVTRSEPKSAPTYGDIRHGFVYERVPHITLKSIANNAEIDVIWAGFEEDLAPLRAELTGKLPSGWLAKLRKASKYTVKVPDDIQEWEVPLDVPAEWLAAAAQLHERFWQLRIARQQEIDASIAAKADHEFLYDKPYEDRRIVRVAGPFTVESISPHRMVTPDGAVGDPTVVPGASDTDPTHDFTSMILENLKAAGVQQSARDDRISFISLTPWPGDMVCAEGRYLEGNNTTERRAGVFVGPEFGTVSRPDLVSAAREAAEAGFDVLIACAFAYDAHATELDRLGRIPVLKARMNADLHMAGDLKSTGKGNLFVVFGEPDIDLIELGDDMVQVKVNGIDVFDPNSGEVRSDSADGIACWFVDTDYDEASFFVRHAYFLGANDPYKSLKTTLKAEIDEDAWASLHSDLSRPFTKPASGRIAVKVINHLGDEVMKVLRVG